MREAAFVVINRLKESLRSQITRVVTRAGTSALALPRFRTALFSFAGLLSICIAAVVALAASFTTFSPVRR